MCSFSFSRLTDVGTPKPAGGLPFFLFFVLGLIGKGSFFSPFTIYDCAFPPPQKRREAALPSFRPLRPSHKVRPH